MQAHEMIHHRRSVRSYQPQPLNAETLNRISELIEDAQPLFEGLAYGWRMVPTGSCTTLQRWRNAQFLAIFTDGTDEGLMNAGFVHQQAELGMQAMGLGTCWVGLGSLKDEVRPPEGMKLALLMAVGRPEGVPLREGPADFRRKEMAKLTDAPDARLEALRLAPSATNSQPWYVTHDGDKMHLWQIKWDPVRARTLRKCNRIDMGIGLAHLYVTHPDTFRFWREEAPPALEGHTYVGSFTL